jgi:hypothetical protein
MTILSLQTAPVGIKQETQTQYNTIQWMPIGDIVKKLPYEVLTSTIPFKIENPNWGSDYPNPSAYDYYKQKCLEQNTELSDINETDVIAPSKEEWVKTDEILLGNEGDQRIQFTDKQTARAVFNRANEFEMPRFMCKLGYIDLKPKELEEQGYDPAHSEKYFAIDGGGSICSASLRNIEYVPANSIVRITDVSQLGDYFFTDAESKQSVSGEEKFKHRLMIEDPLAVLQHDIYKSTGTTAIRNHPNKSLRQFAIAALSVMIKGTFKGRTDTSISGDPVDMVRNEDKFAFRRCQNIKDALEAVQVVWAEPLQLTPSTTKAIIEAYATFGDVMTLRNLTQMLQDYKNGDVEIKGSKIHVNCIEGTIKFSSMDQLSTTGYLQGMAQAGHKGYGSYFFGMLWNHWQKSNRSVKKIQQDFLDHIVKNGKSSYYYYDAKKDYSILKKDIMELV